MNGKVNVSWLKEFCANMDKNRSTAFVFHSWVRGYHITIDADIWSEEIGIGRPEHPVYPFELLEDDAQPVQYDGVSAFLTSRAYAWPGGLLPYSLMQPQFRLLNLLVSHTIEPRGHHTDINRERGFVLFAIAAGRPIDLPAFMVQQMCATGYSPRTAGMPFGMLLTRYMESRRLPTYSDDVIVESRKKINAQTVNQSEAHLPRDNIVPAPVYIDDTLTMEERMENLEAAVVGGFEHMAQQQTEMYEHMIQQHTAMHGQLTTLTESLQRLEISFAQSTAQMAEMLEWMRQQG